jgi:hypothetical protein
MTEQRITTAKIMPAVAVKLSSNNRNQQSVA